MLITFYLNSNAFTLTAQINVSGTPEISCQYIKMLFEKPVFFKNTFGNDS